MSEPTGLFLSRRRACSRSFLTAPEASEVVTRTRRSSSCSGNRYCATNCLTVFASSLLFVVPKVIDRLAWSARVMPSVVCTLQSSTGSPVSHATCLTAPVHRPCTGAAASLARMATANHAATRSWKSKPPAPALPPASERADESSSTGNSSICFTGSVDSISAARRSTRCRRLRLADRWTQPYARDMRRRTSGAVDLGVRGGSAEAVGCR